MARNKTTMRRKSERRRERVASRRGWAGRPGVAAREVTNKGGQRSPTSARSWTPAEREVMAQLERDIERGWVASETGVDLWRDPLAHPWVVVWRGLVALIEAESGPSYDEVMAASRADIESFVDGFLGQQTMLAGLSAADVDSISPLWMSVLLEVTQGLLGPLSRWFAEDRAEHRRLHLLALRRLGRTREAERFADAWREEAPGDPRAWVATSRLHGEPLRAGGLSREAAEAAREVLERGIGRCPDPMGRSLLWAELHRVSDQTGDESRREAAWKQLMRLLD